MKFQEKIAELTELDVFPHECQWRLPHQIKCTNPESDDPEALVCLALHIYINSERSAHWEKVLPRNSSLKYLHLRGGAINQKLLSVVGEISSLERLEADRIRAINIDGIGNLKELTHLALNGISNEESLKSISRLKNLKSLFVGLSPKVASLEALTGLKSEKLKCLSIGGSGDSAQARLDTLEPIVSFKKIEHLLITCLHSKDKSLSFLLDMPNLKTLFISHPKRWDSEDLEGIKRSGVDILVM